MIQIDTMTDEGIISVDHCYLRVVTDGDSWATPPNLQQATIERVGTQIALKKGSDDIIVFTDNAGMVEEAVKALGKVAEAHLRISIDSHSPSKLSKSIGGDWDEGFAIGIEEGIPNVSAVSANMANAAVNAATDVLQNVGVTAEIDAEKSAGAIYSPSHIMRDKVGYMLGLGTAAGLQKSTPEVEDASKNSVSAAVNAVTDVLPNVGITAEIAQALVPQTLGIMSNQGSSAVSAYNPAYQQIQTADMQHQTAPAQNNQGIRDIIIPVSIGDETLETVVVNAITRANASSGGWSV